MLDRLSKQLAVRTGAAKKDFEQLIPKGKEERAKRLALFDAACKDAETDVQLLELSRQKIDDLRAEVNRSDKRIPRDSQISKMGIQQSD